MVKAVNCSESKLFDHFLHYFNWPTDKIGIRLYKNHPTDKSKSEGNVVPSSYRPTPIFFNPEDKNFHMQVYLNVSGERTTNNYVFDFRFKPHEAGYLVTLGNPDDDEISFHIAENGTGKYPEVNFTQLFSYVEEQLQNLLKSNYDKFEDN